MKLLRILPVLGILIGVVVVLQNERGLSRSQSPPGIQTHTVFVTVPATSSWVNSGTTVSAGDTVCISAIANWIAIDTFGRHGPMGVPFACCVINANQGALLGRIGSTGVPFVVGNRFVFIAPAGGPVQLQINDDILTDNTGSARVLVEVAPEGIACPEGP